jgi:16S rRNA pseudouridine516 synthase
MRRQPPPETIGRLDKETSGLILLTDNGAYVHRWSSPRHETAKTYEVTVDADIPTGLDDIFASGTLLLDGESKPCRPATLTLTSPRTATVRLLEGRYHQVRRMFAAHNLTVVRLHRSGVGALTLEGIPEGTWREVQPVDIDGP